MNSLSVSVAAVCWVLCAWTAGDATACGEKQFEAMGRCCDMCPPGKHLKEFCSENKPTVCIPCGEGEFLDSFSPFDRCRKCQMCQQEHTEKCTPTTNAKCSCRSGFLCSDRVCSTCEENKCAAWETVRTDLKGSYQCEPVCQNNTYFDLVEKRCHRYKRCRDLGLAERFGGNETHNAICEVQDDSLRVFLGVGFVSASLALLVILCGACARSLRTQRSKMTPTPVAASPSDFHLSKEESGLQLIVQYESKESESSSSSSSSSSLQPDCERGHS